MPALRHVRVTSRRPPAVLWSCPRCDERRLFDCSGRFRANSNGKLVDIWSIYRCRDCEATKNVTIVERTPVRRVPPALLRGAETNDSRLAHRFARDVALLKRDGLTVGEGDDWTIECGAANERPVTDGAGADPDPDASLIGMGDTPGDGASVITTIQLAFDEPLLVRLDAVLAAVTGLPRRRIPELAVVNCRQRVEALRLWGDCVVHVPVHPRP